MHVWSNARHPARGVIEREARLVSLKHAKFAIAPVNNPMNILVTTMEMAIATNPRCLSKARARGESTKRSTKRSPKGKSKRTAHSRSRRSPKGKSMGSPRRGTKRSPRSYVERGKRRCRSPSRMAQGNVRHRVHNSPRKSRDRRERSPRGGGYTRNWNRNYSYQQDKLSPATQTHDKGK